MLSPWPYAQLPPSGKISAVQLKEIYLVRRNLLETLLPVIWADETFRESCRLGKFSRWVLCDEIADNAEFLVDLAWTVRLLYCLAPPAYLTLDGAGASEYDPNHSMNAGSSPGWHLHRQEGFRSTIVPQLLFGEDAYLGLDLLDKVVNRQVCRPGEFPLLVEGKPQIRLHPKWSRAVDLVEHTKLVSFLIRNPKSRLALFWDVGGVAHRGVENCQSYSANAQIHSRQLPHIFNMVKLGQHVEAMSWHSCCGEE
jgi:hypothetical protein